MWKSRRERERERERESKVNEKLLEAYSQEIGEIKKGMKEFGGNSRD
jgi:hypothetical protein